MVSGAAMVVGAATVELPGAATVVAAVVLGAAMVMGAATVELPGAATVVAAVVLGAAMVMGGNIAGAAMVVGAVVTDGIVAAADIALESLRVWLQRVRPTYGHL